jgi:hypothetical protein
MALCYKDRSYCGSDCVNTACSRFVSPAISAAAASFGLPIAYMDLQTGCPDYRPPAEPPKDP